MTAPEQRQMPHNLEAEEYVLGAMMLAATAIDAVRVILNPADFWRESNARIYKAALDLRDIGQPVDAIILTDELDKRGQLAEVGGKEGAEGGRNRIREIATLVPATSNAAFHAQKIVEAAQLRALVRAGEQIGKLGWDRGKDEGGIDADQLVSRAREIAEGLQEQRAHREIGWLTHQAVLELPAAKNRDLITDLIPAGGVGTIAGVPETHKSWLAQAIAIRVARGQGWILGKEVCAQGPVGYIWQDDSTDEEAGRVKAFELVHPNPTDLPILWALNQGLTFPRDIAHVRRAIETHGLVLVVIDSLYNFLPDIDLKDAESEQIISKLKREVADPTGCTILIVDHMPWATDSNRSRLRAYGGVFKNAATRFGIYIDAIADKLHIEARSNNRKSINKRLAYWDNDTLELKLVTSEDVDPEDLVTVRAERALEWLEENPGQHTSTAVREAVGGKAAITDQALEQLKADGKAIDYGRTGGTWSGKRGDVHYWIASIHAAHSDTYTPSPLFGTGSDVVPSEAESEDYVPENGTGSDVVGRSPQIDKPGALQDHVPEAASPPFRGEADGDVVAAAPPEPRPNPQDEVTTNGTDRLAEQRAWLDAGGWMNNDLDTALLEHFPTTSPYDLPALHDHAAACQARELGVTRT